MNVSDNQKRWIVFGIALNKVLVAKIRAFVEQEIRKEYGNLQTSHNIHTQSYRGRLQRHTVALKYENINGNDTLPRKPGGKYDYPRFDFQVTSHIDLAKLYVENYMAKFNAFNEHCDASAVLTLLGKVPVFPAVVQTTAGDVRKARNAWAHCVFSEWDLVGFQQSFADMNQLVKSLGLPSAHETAILRELNEWQHKGAILCMNATVDPDLVKAVQQDFVALKNDVDKLAFEKEEERQQLQTALLCIITAVEKLDRRVSKIEENQQLMEDDQRSLTAQVFQLGETLDTRLSLVEQEQVIIKENQNILCERFDTTQDQISKLQSDQEDMERHITYLGDQNSRKTQISNEIASCEADIKFFAERHHPDTRKWFLNDFHRWFENPGWSRAYVLLGDAGVGKSVMAGVLAQKSRTTGNLASAYFCRHNDGTRNNPRYLLGTIACQLCKCNARYSNFVGGEGGIRSCLGNSEMGIQELFTKLLQEPLAKCSDSCKRMLIVIDALDETKYESRDDFLDLIMHRFPLLPQWLVFFITSRPEDTVQVRLKEYNPCIKICAGNSENLKFYQQHELDIRLYLEKSVDFSCLPFSAEDVATKCNGLFLFAYYIERVLKDQLYSGKISQLTDLFPGDIGEFFRHNFTRIFRKVGADLYKKLFGCAIAAPSPLPVSFISYILQKENSDLDEQEVIDAFSTFLVVRTSDQTFTFLHSLIPSWLTDKKKALARLSVDRNKGGRYFRDIISEVLSDAIANQQGECPSSMERDVLEYCDQIGVRLLCDYGDSDSLKVVFRYLANYQVIARRLKTKGIEIYSIIGDVKLAICCDEISDREKEILREICIFLENNVDVLLRSPQLLHCCLQESSKTVKENLVFPDSRGATKLDHRLLSFCGLEILSEFDCFSLSPNKKLMARARKGFLSLFDTSTFEEVQGPTTLTGIADDIHHLKFSPDGKFIFFGRLDKWFSLEEGCVKEFSQFNAQKQICYKWSYFLNGSRYIAVQAGHPPTGAHSRTCLINIFCLWAIYELERKYCLRKGSVLFSGWRETCNFQFLYRFELLHNFLQFLEPKLHNLIEVVIETVMKSKECHKSRLCQNCLKFEEQNEKENLNIVRQRVLDLYQEMFEVQVWDVTRGISFLEKAFLENGVQLTPMFFLYHLSAALECESRFLYEENKKLSRHSIAQAILVGSQVPTAVRKWFADEVDKETPFSLYSKRKLEVLNRYFLLDHHLLDNGAVELGNHIVEEWISSSLDRKWSISRYKFGEFDIFKKEDKKFIKKFASKNVEHCVFLEDSNALLYYTRAQSLQIKYLESDIVLTSVTGHSPFFHPSTKQIVYWFVEQHGETINFLRDAPKDLIQFLLLLTTEGVFNGTFISAATVFSLSPKFCETVGKEDVVPFVPVKSVVFSQSGGLIACHLGPKLYICNIFDDAFSHLLCEDQCECDSCHLTFSPDSTLLLHYIQNSNDILRFQVWNVHSRALIVTFDLPAVESLISPLDCCCLSSDNTKLIVCGGFIIEIWEYGASACRLIARIEHHVFISNYSEFTNCTVSSETNLLACCITDRIALCPMNTPTDQSVLLLPPAHLGKIELCQFVKGGRYLISYGVDGNVFLWDLNRCEAIAFAKLCQGRESIKRLCGSCEGDKFFFLTSSGRFGVLTLCGLEHSILLKLPTLKVQSEEMMLEESCGQQRELHGPKVLTHATDDLNVVEFLEEMNLMCNSEGNSESSDDCDDMEMLG